MVVKKEKAYLGRTGRDLPPLWKVIPVHLISLLITLVIGISLFLFRAPLIYYGVAIFITGPIYAVNLPYLLQYVEIVESKVDRKVKDLNNRLQNSSSLKENQMSRSEYIANKFGMSRVRSELKEEKISRKRLIILSLTPIWPVVFYYTLYKISERISIHKGLRDELSLTQLDPESKERFEPSSGSHLFKTSFRHKVFFSAFSIISMIGFALNFYLIGVGFFAPFWILLLHNRLSDHTDFKDGSVQTSQKRREDKYITSTLLAAFLCFGATAGFIAAISNTIYMSLTSPIALISPSAFLLFLVTFIAPFTEEPTKIAGFFFLDKKSAGEIPLYYWAFFGMISGLGFALIENYTYFQSFYLVFSTSDSLYLLLMRFTMPVHLIGSALAGIGVGLWRKKDSLSYLIIFVLLAMVVHGGYNFMVSIGGI